MYGIKKIANGINSRREYLSVENKTNTLLLLLAGGSVFVTFGNYSRQEIKMLVTFSCFSWKRKQ
jgi:hypothetical protein